MTEQYDSCIDWLENMLRILDKRAMADLITTLWNCWNSRNKFIFEGKADNTQTIWDRTSNLVSEDITGYGVIIRDNDGFVLEGGGGFMDTKMSV
ncbi:hypothetical protein PVK06_025045 [Gossypium arboreum]|uniref:Uncharacterized protein n=1 Tax=Gossypium arboreum TaxID=29729 RepID=A0ABR0PFZ5_GOSAR|nr:hypothetical protein PVK06_025045 [Gossypium arboreum]